MRKIVYLLAGLAVLASIGLLAYQRNQLPATLEGLYARYHQRGHRVGIGSPFSGAVLVARGDEVVFKRAYGFADREHDEPLDVDSRFLVGSNAKPFTATLVLQQVEAGVLDLEGSVTGYLADFPAEPGARISLHHLLSHTSGLPRDTVEWDELTLSHAPGNSYEFSNLGYELLVSILEAATRTSYANLLDAGIVKPLGLRNTGFATGVALEKAVVPGSSFSEHSYPLAFFVPGDGSHRNVIPPEAGAVYSTVEDLLRFVRALHANELLSEALTERLLTPTLDGSAYGWFRNHESLFTRNPEAPLYSHVGRLAGHSALVVFYDDGTTAIVLSNVVPIDAAEVLTATYLAAHGTNAVTTDLIHPSLSNGRAFRRDGGAESFLAYYRTLSERAGYPIRPSSGLCREAVELLIRVEAYDEAVGLADTLLEEWIPASPNALNDIGYAFLERDRFEEARRYFERNIELYPDVANTYDSLGELHELQGDLELARARYVQALELAQKNGDSPRDFHEWRLSSLDEKTAP